MYIYNKNKVIFVVTLQFLYIRYISLVNKNVSTKLTSLMHIVILVNICKGFRSKENST